MKISLALVALTLIALPVSASGLAEPDHTHTMSSVSPIQSGYAPVNGLRLYFEIHGVTHPGQVPLVLLHGGGDTIETSFGQVLPLLARDRQVIAFEQQGYGRTANIAERPFSFEQSADDTAALLEYLHVHQADLLGFSNGGTIALQVAIRHPQVVRRFIAISAFYSRDGGYPWFWESMKTSRFDDMPRELKDAYLKVRPDKAGLLAMYQKAVQRMRDFKDIPADRIRAVTAPALVVCGDTDVERPEHAVELYRLLPHARLAVLPSTDHMAIMSRTDWLVPMAAGFLDAAEVK